MVGKMNDDEFNGAKFAIGAYTQLLLEHNDVITQIIEAAYTQGVRAGVVIAQQQMQQEVPEEMPSPEPEPQAPEVPAQEKSGMFTRPNLMRK